MDVAVTSYDDEQQSRRVPLARSSSAVSSNPARHHHHHKNHQHQPHNPHNPHNPHSSASSDSASHNPSVDRRKYQYVPYKSSVSSSNQIPARSEFGSQTSLPSQSRVTAPRSQYVGFPSQGITVQQPARGQNATPSRGQQSMPSQRRQLNVSSGMQQNAPSTHSQNGFRYSAEQSQQRTHHNGGHHPSVNLQRQQNLADQRHVRSNSLKASDRYTIERYAEFSDAYHQFNNHLPPASFQKRGSSSSSDSGPGSPQHSYGHQQLQPQNSQPATHTDYQQRQQRQQGRQTTSGGIQHDLHELQRISSRGPDGYRHNNPEESPYRSSSRNTYAKTNLHAPRRVNGTDTFSLASSIKCCVGFQPKKKSSRRIHHHHHHQARQINRQEQLNNVPSENWVSLAAVKTNYSPQVSRISPSHSTVSCPYTTSASAHRAHKHNNGYTSEIESTQSTPQEDHDSKYESDSDFSDSDFARAASGSRGKSASSVMMKLAKKFSKKSFPITREDGDIGSIGSDSFEGSGKMSAAWRMKHRSNSVTNLDSLDG